MPARLEQGQDGTVALQDRRRCGTVFDHPKRDVEQRKRIPDCENEVCGAASISVSGEDESWQPMGLVGERAKGLRRRHEGGPRRHGEAALAGPICECSNVEADRGDAWGREGLWRALHYVVRIRLRVADSDLDVYCKIPRSRRVWDTRSADPPLPWSDKGCKGQKIPVVFVVLTLTIKARAPGQVRASRAVRSGRVRPVVRAGSGKQRSGRE